MGARGSATLASYLVRLRAILLLVRLRAPCFCLCASAHGHPRINSFNASDCRPLSAGGGVAATQRKNCCTNTTQRHGTLTFHPHPGCPPAMSAAREAPPQGSLEGKNKMKKALVASLVAMTVATPALAADFTGFRAGATIGLADENFLGDDAFTYGVNVGYD